MMVVEWSVSNNLMHVEQVSRTTVMENVLPMVCHANRLTTMTVIELHVLKSTELALRTTWMMEQEKNVFSTVLRSKRTAAMVNVFL